MDALTQQLLRAMADRLNPQPPPTQPGLTWAPTPKQATAQHLTTQAFETLYGGAAGGGKSYFIAHDAADYCLQHPGAHVAIVRRTLPMLKQTHLLTLRPLLHDHAKHNATELTWSFGNGSLLRLISLQHDGDEQAYKSVEFDRLYFDEVTELTHAQYTYMLTRLRSKHGHQVAAFAAANPEGVGYRWVRDRWITPTTTELAGQPTPGPLTVWRPAQPGTGQATGPARVYIPATVHDNQHLLAANPGYVAQLEALPDPRKRAALLHGDWSAMDRVEGALWSRTALDATRVPECPEGVARTAIGFDPATTFHASSDETGLVAVSSTPVAPRHTYVIADRSGRYSSPEAVGAALVALAADTDADCIVYETNQGGEYIAALVRSAFRAAVAEGRWSGPAPKLVGVTAKRGKVLRATPVAQYYGQGQVHHVGAHPDLEDQMTTWTPDTGTSPDRLDALVYAVLHLLGRPAAPVAAPARRLW